MSLRIAEGVSFVDELMLMSAMVLGMPESGKTTIAKVLCEEVWKIKQRFGVLDPKGDYYGLGSSADGQSAAIPVVVFGGEHAHVPIEPNAGKLIANVVAHDLQQPFVIDLEKFSKSKQITFVADFCEELYHTNRDPLLIVFDEIERFAPEKTQFPEAHRCLGAVQDIFSLGRKHGLGRLGIAQRGAEANKTVTDKCDMGIFFRATGVLDQKRVRGWLEANMRREDIERALNELPELATGQCIIASARREIHVFKTVQVRELETFDTSKTPGLKRRRREPKILAQPDLVALQTQMHSQLSQLQANDPGALKRKVEEQRWQIASQSKRMAELEERLKNAKAPREKIVRKEVKVPVLDEPLLIRYARAVTLAYTSALKDATIAAETLAKQMAHEWTPPPQAEPVTVTQAVKSQPVSPLRDGDGKLKPEYRVSGKEYYEDRYGKPKSESNGKSKLSIASQRILNAALMLEQMGISQPSVPQLAVLAKHTPGDSYWRAAIGRLRVSGLMAGTMLTEEGRALAQAPEITTHEQMRSFVLDDVLRSQAFARRLMQWLLDHPGEHPADEVAKGVGYDVERVGDSYWRAALGRLRRLQLVTKSGLLAANQHLFLLA